jgi:hypothetical protein
MLKTTPICALCITAVFAPFASADVFSTYGATTVLNAGPPTVYQLLSDPNGTGYAGIYEQITATLTVSQLIDLEANYQMTQGTFGGGAPRFSLIDTTNNPNNEAYIYWGTPTGGGGFTDSNAGSPNLNGTGNYADLTSTDLRVAVNGFGGINALNTYVTWSQFVAEAGTVDIGYISLDLDGGFTGTQQMSVDNFTINGTVVSNQASPVPEPGSVALLLTVAALIGSATYRRRRTIIKVEGR